jgi:amino-acid N-acetyltransferase
LFPASQNSFTAAIRLLENCKLPASDIQPETKLFVMEEGNKVIATVALEHDHNDALLRSLSVETNYRNKGVGQQLVSFIEDYARQQGVQNIYLLTTTAADFFNKKGYQKIERTEAPPFIQNTSEFSSVCPSSATVMKKQLA